MSSFPFNPLRALALQNRRARRSRIALVKYSTLGQYQARLKEHKAIKTK